MKNIDTPSVPVTDERGMPFNEVPPDVCTLGFTKRERACIDLRIPESGDAELDTLIEKARRQEIAAKAMEAMIVNAVRNGYKSATTVELYRDAAIASGAILHELERTDG